MADRCGLGELEGSRVYESAKRRMSKPSYWQKVAGLHPDFYRPKQHWEILKGHVIDTHSLLATDFGEGVMYVVGAIFPIVGVALAGIRAALTKEEQELLAAELAEAQLRACAANVDECEESDQARWWVEYHSGTTMSPGTDELTPEAAEVLYRYLADGGPPEDVASYFAELEKRRTAPSKFDLATGKA